MGVIRFMYANPDKWIVLPFRIYGNRFLGPIGDIFGFSKMIIAYSFMEDILLSTAQIALSAASLFYV